MTYEEPETQSPEAEPSPDPLQEPAIQQEIADSDDWMQKGLNDPEEPERREA